MNGVLLIPSGLSASVTLAAAASFCVLRRAVAVVTASVTLAAASSFCVLRRSVAFVAAAVLAAV
jgi:hypothetical protein